VSAFVETRSGTPRVLVLLKDSLGGKIGQLGLGFGLWDASKTCLATSPAPNEFCRTLCPRGCLCEADRQRLRDQVLDSGEPASLAASSGCVLLGVPIRRRLRIVGALICGYPAGDLLDDEELARLCDRAELDRRIVEEAHRNAARYTSANAEQMLAALTWMVEAEQSLAAARAEAQTLSANLSSTYEELSLVYRISGSMRVTQQPPEFLQTTCEDLREVMGVDAVVAIVYAHPPANEDDVLVLAGETPLSADEVRRFLAEHVEPRFENNQPILENHFVKGAEAVENFAAALLVTDEPIGVLAGLNKSGGDINSVDLKLIDSICSQLAVYFANHRLYADMEDLLMGVLHALTETIDAKDPYTCGHSQRVALISKRLAEMRGFSPLKVQEIYLAGLLHDIGKVGVSEATLRKEGRLTDEEYADMKRHPGLGGKILEGIRQLEPIMIAVRTHHERPDGRGYPNGLEGAEVPIEGRIVGLADSFDAMTSDRTYRKALPLETVIEEVRKHAGTQFDPELVDLLLSLDLRQFLAELRSAQTGSLPADIRKELQR